MSAVEDTLSVPASTQPSKSPVSGITQDLWNGVVDAFILQFLEQVKKERGGVRDIFSAKVWTNLASELQLAGHPAYSSEQLKDHFRELKKSKSSLSAAAPPSASAPLSSVQAPASFTIPSLSAPPATPSPLPAVSPTISPSDRANWTAEPEALLIEHLVKVKAEGSMAENNFTGTAYNGAAVFLRSKGFSFRKTQVKARWTRFKKDFKIVAKLRTLSGFGWDNVRSMVTATDQVWDAYLAGNHAKARPFRTKPFLHYDDIASLIGHSTATGTLAMSSENSACRAWKDSDSSSSESSDDNDDEDEDDAPQKKRPSRSAPTTPAPSKRVRISAGAQALTNMSTAVSTLTDGIRSGAFMALPVTDSPVKKEQAFSIVRKEEGLSPYSLSKARRVFRGSGEVAREYLSFDTTVSEEKEARHFWLLGEMDANNKVQE